MTSFVNEDNTVTVSVSKPDYANQHFLDAEKYADSVRFVKLETTDDNLISGVSELLFSDDYIIIADHRTATIHFFDHDGNYSHKIHRRGRGPGEYIGLSRVMLDRENDVIIVLDLDSRAMLYYDFKGNLISKTENFCDGMIARDIINLPSGDFLCYRQDKLGPERKWRPGLWRAKKNGSFDKFIYTFDYDYESNFVQYNYHLSELPDDRISFVDQNQTAVFYVDGDVVYKRVQFDLPGKTEADFPGEAKRREGYYAIFTNQEKGDFIFTQWSDDQNRVFHTVYTKSTGELETGLTFRYFAFGHFLPGGEFVRNNDPYISSTWFYPFVVDQFLESDPPEEFKSKAQKIIEGISPEQMQNSNPILQLLYIKK